MLRFIFWRKGWDSNPCAGLPTTAFRVRLVTTTSIPFRTIAILLNSYFPDTFFKRVRAAPLIATQVSSVYACPSFDNRYLSVLLLNLITILLKITNGFYYTLKYSKMQAIINKLSIINKLFSKYKYAYKTCFLLINYYIIYPLLMKNF